MTSLLWVSLAVFVLALVGGVAFAGLRALGTWRAFRSLGRNVDAALLDATRRLEQVEQRLADDGAKAARLEASRRRLQDSLSTATLLFRAFSETWAAVSRVAGVVPHK